jgi:hypothetical protein
VLDPVLFSGVARAAAQALVADDLLLAGRPALRQAVLDVLDADRAEFLEKA